MLLFAHLGLTLAFARLLPLLPRADLAGLIYLFILARERQSEVRRRIRFLLQGGTRT